MEEKKEVEVQEKVAQESHEESKGSGEQETKEKKSGKENKEGLKEFLSKIGVEYDEEDPAMPIYSAIYEVYKNSSSEGLKAKIKMEIDQEKILEAIEEHIKEDLKIGKSNNNDEFAEKIEELEKRLSRIEENGFAITHLFESKMSILQKITLSLAIGMVVLIVLIAFK